MPVDHAIALAQFNFDEATSAWPACTFACVWDVLGTMRGAQQPAATGIKKLIRLKVHLHRHMGATVEVGVRQTFKANGKRAAGLAGINNIKRHGTATFSQVGAVAQRDDLDV